MKKLLMSIAACIALASAGNAQVLVNETFADGNRTNQNPPNSLAWYASSTIGTRWTVSNNVLYDDSAARSNGLAGYFTNVGESVTLTIGQTIVASYDINMQINTGANSANNVLTFGLFDSKEAANRQTGDGVGGTTPTSTGYAFFLDLASTGTQSLELSKRDKLDQGGALITNDRDFTRMISSTQADLLVSDKDYHLEFSIERTGETEAVITITITGGDLTSAMTTTFTDSNSTYFSYDTIAFSTFQGNAGILPGVGYAEFSNIGVSVIPEPAAAGLLVGALGLLVAIRRRR